MNVVYYSFHCEMWHTPIWDTVITEAFLTPINNNTMGKYRKKPVVIEAVQLMDNDKSIREVTDFIFGKKSTSENTSVRKSIMEMDYWDSYLNKVRKDGGIRLKTLESDNETQIANFGDFVIKGVSGEFYPCKEDIFAKTYQPADESAPSLTLQQGFDIWDAGYHHGQEVTDADYNDEIHTPDKSEYFASIGIDIDKYKQSKK